MPEYNIHCESIFGAVKITILLRAPIKMTLHSNGLFRIWTASGCIDNAVHCLFRLPCQTRKRSFSVRRFILIGTLLLAGLLVHKAEAEAAVATTQSPHILVLDNCDSDYKIPIDASDGSVWITDTDTPRLYHYSSKGKKLDTSENLSNDHKWITILPKQNGGD
jgi:hypothetical protein